MISNQILADIQSSQTNQDKLTQQLGTGDNILVPSDDVMGTVRSMDYRVDISSNGQYQTNINNATNNLNQTNTALTSISDTLTTISSLLGSVSSGGAQGNQQVDASQASQLTNQLLDYANTKIGNDYMFLRFPNKHAALCSGHL